MSEQKQGWGPSFQSLKLRLFKLYLLCLLISGCGGGVGSKHSAGDQGHGDLQQQSKEQVPASSREKDKSQSGKVQEETVSIPEPRCPTSLDCRSNPDGSFVHLPTGIVFKRIPAGQFETKIKMAYFGVKQYAVEVRGFWIASTEVTVAQYRVCVSSGACSPPKRGKGCTWSPEPSDQEDYPVNCLDWLQARSFAKYLYGDLPSEAQWEYAAQGGHAFTYAGSDDPDKVGWHYHNSGQRIHPVSGKEANSFGLFDMSGNVWEWTLDQWTSDYYEGLRPKEAKKPVGLVPPLYGRMDKVWLTTYRTCRGGSWSTFPRYLYPSSRYGQRIIHQGSDTGFRPVKNY